MRLFSLLSVLLYQFVYSIICLSVTGVDGRGCKLYNEIIQLIVSVVVSVCLHLSLSVCNRSGCLGM